MGKPRGFREEGASKSLCCLLTNRRVARALARCSKPGFSLTSRTGKESNRELSGTGWRTDLYSAFGIQRILGRLGARNLFREVLWYRSRREFAQKAAKSAETCEPKYRLLTIRDLLAGRKSFELSVQVIVRQEVTCFGTLRGVRKDVDSFDLLRALIGVSNVASSPDWLQSARRLVDILITGSRPIK